MDNVDEIEAYRNENGSFDVVMSLTQEGQPTKATFRNMHLSIEMAIDGSVKLVFES